MSNDSKYHGDELYFYQQIMRTIVGYTSVTTKLKPNFRMTSKYTERYLWCEFKRGIVKDSKLFFNCPVPSNVIKSAEVWVIL